jgi:hypothetical protein
MLTRNKAIKEAGNNRKPDERTLRLNLKWTLGEGATFEGSCAINRRAIMVSCKHVLSTSRVVGNHYSRTVDPR